MKLSSYILLISLTNAVNPMKKGMDLKDVKELLESMPCTWEGMGTEAKCAGEEACQGLSYEECMKMNGIEPQDKNEVEKEVGEVKENVDVKVEKDIKETQPNVGIQAC